MLVSSPSPSVDVELEMAPSQEIHTRAVSLAHTHSISQNQQHEHSQPVCFHTHEDAEPVEIASVPEGTVVTVVNPPPFKQHIHDGHIHGLLFTPGVDNTIAAYILEFGLTSHSVIVGITLGVVAATELNTLVPALTFHQFFEGTRRHIDVGCQASKRQCGGAVDVECSFSYISLL